MTRRRETSASFAHWCPVAMQKKSALPALLVGVEGLKEQTSLPYFPRYNACTRHTAGILSQKLTASALMTKNHNADIETIKTHQGGFSRGTSLQ